MKLYKKIYIADIKTASKDGTLGGHYVPVAKNYCEIFPDRKIVVAGGPAYCHYFSKEQLCPLPYNVVGSSLTAKIKTFVNSIILFFKARNQIIVLQQSSVVTSFIAILLFYWKTSRLFLIQYNTEALSKWHYRRLYALAKWKIDGTICPNDRIGIAYERPYVVVPDYIKTSILPRINYEEKEYDFCMMGTIWPDKGVVEAARKLQGTTCKVVIAGAVAVTDLLRELKEIESKCTNIRMILRRVSDEEYKSIIQSSRYCILNYQGGYNDRSSGVVLDIIHNGVPIVGHRCEALKIVDDSKCGHLYDNIDDWKPMEILSREIYGSFVSSIESFVQKQITEKTKLLNFVDK